MTMPPSGFGKKSVEGALQFILGCYEDLQKEVESGKHESFEDALKYEIDQLRSALGKVHIDNEGHLVDRD